MKLVAADFTAAAVKEAATDSAVVVKAEAIDLAQR